MKRASIKSLYTSAVDAMPIEFDWSEGYGERWETIMPDVDNWTRAECLAWFKQNGDTFASAELDADTDDERVAEMVLDAMQGAERFVPMMNYAYPLPRFNGDAHAAQTILDRDGGSVCIVDIGGEYFLALTGGGMDLSWDIAEAYMLLGYLPPFHYCRLPQFADRLTTRKRWILAGCKRTCQVIANTARRTLEDLRHVRKAMAERK